MAVLVPFPFSDLSQAKLRLAVALADVGRGDWILCQITSNPYGDAHAVRLEDASFTVGEQTYTREAERSFRYHALVDGEPFIARLDTDAFGHVVRSEGLWEAELAVPDGGRLRKACLPCTWLLTPIPWFLGSYDMATQSIFLSNLSHAEALPFSTTPRSYNRCVLLYETTTVIKAFAPMRFITLYTL
jgi:hypothetical protein